MGIVYHANYLVYFDVGRTEYLRAAGSDYAELERDGYRLVVVETCVRYLQPARFDEALRLEVVLSELGRASLCFQYVLRSPADIKLATGHTRLGCLDARYRPVGLPARTLSVLRQGRFSVNRPSDGP